MLRAVLLFISLWDCNVNFLWARVGLKRTVELDGWCPFEVVLTFNDSPKVCEAPWRTQDVSSSSHSPHVCQTQTLGSHSLRQGRFGRVSFPTCPCDTLSQIQLARPVLQGTSCPLPLITTNPLPSRGTQQSCDSRHRYELGRDTQSVL